MDFKFSFLPETEQDPYSSEDSTDDNVSNTGTVSNSDGGPGITEEQLNDVSLPCLNAAEIHPDKSLITNTVTSSYTQITVGDGIFIKYITPPEKYSSMGNGQHTDLIPGQYEGGAKTWECSFILLDYIAEHLTESLEGKYVLEVGCGSGLPGIYCLQRKAYVTFQDYNKEVIEDITIPNVRLSYDNDDTSLLKNCRFYSGDWRKLIPLLSGHRYDIILASEVTYNTDSYSKLHDLLDGCSSATGVIYMASKYHYFGVGGGVESFKSYLETQGVFKVEVVFTTQQNLKCVVLKITRDSTT